MVRTQAVGQEPHLPCPYFLPHAPKASQGTLRLPGLHLKTTRSILRPSSYVAGVRNPWATDQYQSMVC